MAAGSMAITPRPVEMARETACTAIHCERLDNWARTFVAGLYFEWMIRFKRERQQDVESGQRAGKVVESDRRCSRLPDIGLAPDLS
jgi:hypothetical protein